MVQINTSYFLRLKQKIRNEEIRDVTNRMCDFFNSGNFIDHFEVRWVQTKNYAISYQKMG